MNINYDKVFNIEKPESKHCKFFPKNIMAVICGSTGCGKTNLLYNLLLNPGRIYYDDVSIWCPTLHQSNYQGLLELYRRAGTNCQCYSESDEILDPQKFDSSLEHVICFDDVMNKNQTKIRDYFSCGRHNNFNVFYLCQSLYKIPKHGIRENANIFVLFRQDIKSLKSFYDSHVNSDMLWDVFKGFCDRAWQKPYGYVVINLWSRPDKMKYIDTYETVFHPPK